MELNNRNNFNNYIKKKRVKTLPFWAYILIMVLFLTFTLISFAIFIPEILPLAEMVFIPLFMIAIIIFFALNRSAKKFRKKLKKYKNDNLKYPHDSGNSLKSSVMNHSDKINGDMIEKYINFKARIKRNKFNRKCSLCGERLEPDENICPRCGMWIN